MSKQINREIRQVLALWGIKESLDIKKENIAYDTDIETHIWTINEEYILKMTNNEDEIARNVYISKLLLKAGIRVQEAISNLNGEVYCKMGNSYYGLFTKLKGEVLKDYYEGDYIKRGFYLGQSVATLHQGLKNITDELKYRLKLYDNNMIEELSGWVSDEIKCYIQNDNLPKKEIEGLNKIIEEINKNFKQLYDKLPRQVIHRDVHGENMIFQDNRLVGYIDFDLSQINARIFDICYLCTGALGKIFNVEEMREKWIPFARAVIDGYGNINKLSVEEQGSIKYMFYSIELIMIAFFARDGYTELADSNIIMLNWINSVFNN